MIRGAAFGGLLLAASLAGLAGPAARAEGVVWEFTAYPKFDAVLSSKDPPPIVVTDDQAPRYVLTRFIIDGASAEEWVEAFEVMNTLRKNEPKKIAAWYAGFRKLGDETCPGTWQLLDETASSMVFERVTGECPNFVAQQALYRVMYGKHNVFTLIATRKGGMDDAMRAGWLGLLRSATIQ